MATGLIIFFTVYVLLGAFFGLTVNRNGARSDQ